MMSASSGTVGLQPKTAHVLAWIDTVAFIDEQQCWRTWMIDSVEPRDRAWPNAKVKKKLQNTNVRVVTGLYSRWE